jgi:prophage regulatory protein
MNDIVHSRPRVVLRLKQVVARTGLSRSTIYVRMQAGEFPAPIALGVRAVGWLESDIEAWIAARPSPACPHIPFTRAGTRKGRPRQP